MAAWNFYDGIATCLDCGFQVPGDATQDHTCDPTLYLPIVTAQGNVILAHDAAARGQVTSEVPGWGAGTELKQQLGRFGISATADCSCHARALEMDRRGTAWCRQNIDTIVGWLREEAERRGLPLVEIVARQLIKSAIRRAEKNQTARQPAVEKRNSQASSGDR